MTLPNPAAEIECGPSSGSKQTRIEPLRALEREGTFFLARSLNPEQQS